MKAVLRNLHEAGLYSKVEKCEFHRQTIAFLGFVIGENDVSMDADKISTIEDWPVPKSMKEILGFSGFAYFYRRFIRKYTKITAPITNLLKEKEKLPRFR